jgi:hypothetical protein
MLQSCTIVVAYQLVGTEKAVATIIRIVGNCVKCGLKAGWMLTFAGLAEQRCYKVINCL